jgi:hypothetical protein
MCRFIVVAGASIQSVPPSPSNRNADGICTRSRHARSSCSAPSNFSVSQSSPVYNLFLSKVGSALSNLWDPNSPNQLICAFTCVVPVSSPIVKVTLTGFTIPLRFAPLPGALNA